MRDTNSRSCSLTLGSITGRSSITGTVRGNSRICVISSMIIFPCVVRTLWVSMASRASREGGRVDLSRLATRLSSRRYRTSVFQSIKREILILSGARFVVDATEDSSVVSPVSDRVNSSVSLLLLADGATQKVENIPFPLRLTLASLGVTQPCFPAAMSRSAGSFVAWIRLDRPLASILDAVLMVSPNL